MNRLTAYLRDNLILDFQGDLTLEMIRDMIRDDDTRESRTLMGKLVEERGVDEMLITLADCLLDQVKAKLTDDVIREQLRTYSES